MDKEQQLIEIIGDRFAQAKINTIKSDLAIKNKNCSKMLKITICTSSFIILFIAGLYAVSLNNRIDLTNQVSQLKIHYSILQRKLSSKPVITEPRFIFSSYDLLDARGRTGSEAKREIDICNGFVTELDGVGDARIFKTD